jgi:hypothetical protein
MIARSVVLIVTISDNVVRNLWNWFRGGVWKGLEVWAGEGLECYQQRLVGNSGKGSDQNADRNAVKIKLMKF